jgi:hypothetical protein
MYTIEDGSRVEEIPDNYTGIAITSYGGKLWYQEGKLHRLDGPAWEWANGAKSWYHHGKLHRLDGPAWEGANGTKIWYHDGTRHRLDGPAVERANGTEEWWIFNFKINKLTKIICII